VAMVGKECVAIAADTRLGIQAQTISTDFEKVFQMGPKLFCGLPGLATDVLTVYAPSEGCDSGIFLHRRCCRPLCHPHLLPPSPARPAPSTPSPLSPLIISSMAHMLPGCALVSTRLLHLGYAPLSHVPSWYAASSPPPPLLEPTPRTSCPSC